MTRTQNPVRRGRGGVATLEVLLVISTLFVIAMSLFWFAASGFAGLYQLISGYNGSPYM